MLEAAATSFASILVLGAGFGIAAYAYHKSYKYMVLQKMANAFEPGDPVLDLAAIGKDLPLAKTAAATHWYVELAYFLFFLCVWFYSFLDSGRSL